MAEDEILICSSCGEEFAWKAGERAYYAERGYAKPKRCPVCRRERKNAPQPALGLPLIDQERIVSFVRSVERHKGYKEDPRLVFAHLIEEAGELAGALWRWEKECLTRDSPDATGIGRELLDIVFLATYLAEILRIDLARLAPGRMGEIRKEYRMEEKNEL